MHDLQHGSDDKILQALDPECVVIYENFDMIVKVLRTTEDGVIDAGAQKALNKFCTTSTRRSSTLPPPSVLYKRFL